MCSFCNDGIQFNVFTQQYEACTHCQKPNTPSSFGSWSVDYAKHPDPTKDIVKGSYNEYSNGTGDPVKKEVKIKKWWER